MIVISFHEFLTSRARQTKECIDIHVAHQIVDHSEGNSPITLTVPKVDSKIVKENETDCLAERRIKRRKTEYIECW